MESNITINIVEPGGPTPVVPDTGLFTSGIGGPEATILGITAAVIILAVVLVVLYYRKKQGKFISLSHKKATTIGLASLAAVVSLGTVAGLLKLGASAIDAEADEAEEVAEVTDGELTIELGNEPVFAWVKSTVTVTEDMPAGYTLKAYSEYSTLSAEGTDKTISMVTIPEDGLENAGTLATALTDNTWGLSIEEPESQADEIYFSLPATAEEAIIIKSIDVHSPTEAGDETTVYYGVYIAPGLPYGTYTGANVSYEVEPHYITNLSFDGNGSDGGTAMEGMTLLAGDTITLPVNTYTRTGYNFTGWNTAAEGTGKAYADEAEFTASLTESEDITLYAQWEEDLPIISDLTEMQDFAKLSAEEKASVLASMTPGQQYQLKDNRDQTMYYIAKLADGHVWMTQNLDLDLISDPTAEGYVALTPANTNITANWTPDNSTIAIQDGSFPGWENNNNIPYSADPGDVYYYTSGNNNPDTATDKATCEQAHQDGSCAHYHAGNYYSWSAAVASNNTEGIAERYANVETSICPAGWRLPKNRNAEGWTAGNEQDAMIASYDGIVGEVQTGGGGAYAYRNYLEGGFNAIRTAPLWLARSGSVEGGSLNYPGSNGAYWSSTVYSSSSSYLFYFNSGDVGLVSNNGRGVGYSVRCIAQ